jgi:hypothetical protein
MIIRLTQKLAQRIKVNLSRNLPLAEDPFADWSAHLFTAQRAHYIIMTNARSLYSIVMHGGGVTNDDKFVYDALFHLRELMKLDGALPIYHRFIVPTTRIIHFSRTNDKKVLGSMNDFIFQAKWILREPTSTPFDAAIQINKGPMSMLNYANPKEALVSFIHEE